MKLNSLSIIVGLVVWGCTPSEKEHFDEISGIYVRQHSFNVVNQESGEEVGTRTVRDTIFVRPLGVKFEVSNRKWFNNDYDLDGWRNMNHSDHRSVPPYVSTYDPVRKALSVDGGPTLFFDGNTAYWNTKAKYARVKP